MTFSQFAVSLRARMLDWLKTVPSSVRQTLARWWEALQLWSSTGHNPFWALAHRIEARHGNPARIWFWATLVWAFFAWCSVSLWDSPQAHDGQLPAAVGRDATGFLSLLWLNIFLGAAFVAARLRSAALLRSMLLKGQLLPLQLAPLENEQRAWYLTAPPALVGFCVALAALPALCFGVGHGEWMFRDLLGLAVVLVVGVWSVPKWSPNVWQAQIEKKAASQEVDFWKPLRLALSWTGWRSLFLGGGLLFFAAPALIFDAPWSIIEGMSPEVTQLFEASWLHWPLLLSRLLMVPLPFFGFALPPVCLLLPLWMATQDRKLLRLTAVLGADRLFWTRERQLRWYRDEQLIAVLWIVTAFGFLWPGLVSRGLLATFWTPGALPPGFTSQETLAAWFYLCVFGTVTAASALWRETLEQKPVDGARTKRQRQRSAPTPRELWPVGWVRARRALLVGVALWLGGCVMDWQTPLSLVMWKQEIVALALGVLWLLAQTGLWLGHVADDNASIKARLPRYLKTINVHFWWFYGAFALINVPVWWLAPRGQWHPWMLTLSPISLWLAPHYTDVLDAPWFWCALMGHTSFAAWWFRRIWRCLPVPRRRRQHGNTTALPRLDTQQSTAFDWKPTNAKAPAGKVRLTNLTRTHLWAPTPQQQWILGQIARFDNPLLVLELRRLMGRNDWISSWINTAGGLCAAGVIAIIVIIAPDHGPGKLQLSSAGYFSFWLLGILAFILVLAYSSYANDSYDRDRLDGSLESVFLSPLSEVAIAQSKIIPYFVMLWPPTLLLLPFLLVSAALISLDGDYLMLPLALVVTATLISFATRNVTLSHFLAVTSRKTGQGSTRMALVALPVLLVELAGIVAALNRSTGALWLALVAYSIVLWLEALGLWLLALVRLKALRRTR